jgi:hypothetical protein
MLKFGKRRLSPALMIGGRRAMARLDFSSPNYADALKFINSAPAISWCRIEHNARVTAN